MILDDSLRRKEYSSHIQAVSI